MLREVLLYCLKIGVIRKYNCMFEYEEILYFFSLLYMERG